VLNSIFPLVTLDVRNSESIQAAVAKIIASSGRLDILSIMQELELRDHWNTFRRDQKL
jgi:NAD(P)-dependent dehydrogenase (short-subunit alcohol dehydrogenase family)